ncbi:MAG: ATP-dependent DNA helicase RecG [Actinomycetota bacterium]|nr:ATP-dependent DNA helicase RecG [Actinomycetota bacterium]
MAIGFASPVAAVAGKLAGRLEKGLGIATVGGLLTHYPRRYVDKGSLRELDLLAEGAHVTCFGRVVSAKSKNYQDRRTRRTAYRLEAVVDTGETRLSMTFFDRQNHTAQWRERTVAVGRYGLFSGKLGTFRDDWQLTNPQTKMFGDQDDAADAFASVPNLIPIYPATSTVQSWELEDTIRVALDVVDQVPDVLPVSVREAADLLDIGTAYQLIHRPDTWAQKVKSEQRLKYDEAFVSQTVLARSRVALQASPASPRAGRIDGVLDRFDARLPFELTAGQREVGQQVLEELARPHPMHRLLQGEVGSGKTIVALRAMLRVVDSGGQAVLLAPTEVLAQQHLGSVTALLGDLGHGGLLGADDVATRVALLTGSMGAPARKQALLDAVSGEAGIVIGTHALLEEHVQFADLGLVVVDEQHRFGVEQRAALTGKAGVPPHLLVMTATPIPRTVAMTVFGDLDTSTLRELPAGRGDVQTNVVPAKAHPAWLGRAWTRIREEVGAGRQAYVVCPRIGRDKPHASEEPRGVDGPDDSTLQAVEKVAPELAAGALAGLKVEMLHGQLAADDKARVMRGFAAGEVDVLVTTTVIEVGVDVPNATVMVVLDADRFGVSQLHQLRGRIGRGGHAGLCLLVTDADPEGPSMERLRAVAGSRDGFELSRIDLAQRREGNVLGKEQSGRASALRLLSVLSDEVVIVEARAAATAYLAEDPELSGVPDLHRAVAQLESSDLAEYLEMA